jgi:hypothetical protein
MIASITLPYYGDAEQQLQSLLSSDKETSYKVLNPAFRHRESFSTMPEIETATNSKSLPTINRL